MILYLKLNVYLKINLKFNYFININLKNEA
jgi:hypothetical protein